MRYARLLPFAFALVGCHEATWIRSSPPDAAVYVDGQLVGVTPVRFVTPRSQFSDHMRYRIVRDGYEPEEGTLRTAVRPGRIFGGLFTIGLVWALRGVTGFDAQHDIALRQVPPPPPPPPPPAPAATPEQRKGDVVDW